jgi:hypothetical protein
MNSTNKGILTLLRSAVTGEKLELPADFDLTAAYPMIRRYQLVPLAYEGALNCGVNQTLPVMNRLCNGYCQCFP